MVFAVVCTIAATSKHAIKMVPKLIDQYSYAHILNDVGYLNKGLHQRLTESGIDFWTQKRKNMKRPKVDQRLLKRQRRYMSLYRDSLFKLDGFALILSITAPDSWPVSKREVNNACLSIFTLESANTTRISLGRVFELRNACKLPAVFTKRPEPNMLE